MEDATDKNQQACEEREHKHKPSDNLCIGLEHTLTAVLKTQEAKERISGYYEVLISTCKS